jgi:hypothetical protein
LRLLCVCLAATNRSVALAQEHREPNVLVSAGSGEAEHDQFVEPGEYAQPAWAERSRMSATTSAYVLSPFEVFAGTIWEADVRRHVDLAHELTQEIDLGLPNRFELGLENEIGIFADNAYETSVTAEARYAFANWNAISLNPAISAEYIFGTGKSVRFANDESHRHSDRLNRQPDAVALRLLLAQNFGDHVGYGCDFAIKQNVGHDSGREFEIRQAITHGIMKGTFEAGAQMRFAHNTPQFNRHQQNDLALGPSLGWKATRQFRLEFAPLVGCTHESPRLASVLLVSYEFGGAEAIVRRVSEH